MKLELDPEADALSFWLGDQRVVESEEVQPGVILDFNAEGVVVGVELLQLSKRMSRSDMERVEFVTAAGGAGSSTVLPKRGAKAGVAS